MSGEPLVGSPARHRIAEGFSFRRGALNGSSERTHEVVALAAQPQAIQFDVLSASNVTIAV